MPTASRLAAHNPGIIPRVAAEQCVVCPVQISRDRCRLQGVAKVDDRDLPLPVYCERESLRAAPGGHPTKSDVRLSVPHNILFRMVQRSIGNSLFCRNETCVLGGCKGPSRATKSTCFLNRAFHAPSVHAWHAAWFI